MIEEWKDIKGYEGLYQVSNLGRVKRKKILTPWLGTDKYNYISLSKNGNVTKFKVHRLVAKAFIPNPDNKPTVDHINRDRLDNRVENLRWATYKEQRSNQTSTETKIKAIDIATGEYNYYKSQVECGKKLNLSSKSINDCLRNKQKQLGGYIFEYSK